MYLTLQTLGAAWRRATSVCAIADTDIVDGHARLVTWVLAGSASARPFYRDIIFKRDELRQSVSFVVI